MPIAVFIHIAEVSSQDEAPAAKRLQSSLGLIMTITNVFDVAN